MYFSRFSVFLASVCTSVISVSYADDLSALLDQAQRKGDQHLATVNQTVLKTMAEVDEQNKLTQQRLSEHTNAQFQRNQELYHYQQNKYAEEQRLKLEERQRQRQLALAEEQRKKQYERQQRLFQEQDAQRQQDDYRRQQEEILVRKNEELELLKRKQVEDQKNMADQDAKRKEEELKRAKIIAAQEAAKRAAEQKAKEAEQTAQAEKIRRQNAVANNCIGLTNDPKWGRGLYNGCSNSVNIKYTFSSSRPFSGSYTTLRPGAKSFDTAKDPHEQIAWMACFFPAVPANINGGCV